MKLIKSGNKKGVLLFLVLSLGGFVILITTLPSHFGFTASSPIAQMSQACIKEMCFNVELATTPEEREQGLMYRDSLAADAAMLFLFGQEGNYPFWMKNTKIPLDVIWIDKDKKVVFISKNVQPCGADYCPDVIPAGSALYVLEIKAGMAEKIGIKRSDQVSFK